LVLEQDSAEVDEVRTVLTACRSPRSNGDESMKERERRGSILSIWKKGKDEHGNDTIIHDDEEWKV
jgi:hypothetical protein